MLFAKLDEPYVPEGLDEAASQIGRSVVYPTIWMVGRHAVFRDTVMIESVPRSPITEACRRRAVIRWVEDTDEILVCM
jgi:hypothetical protein